MDVIGVSLRNIIGKHLPPREEGVLLLGEAILIKALSGGGGSSGTVTAVEGIFCDNATYICSKSGTYTVTCVGGGGGGAKCSKWLPEHGWEGDRAVSNINLTQGQSVVMTIGAGGKGANGVSNTSGYSGGTTSFGGYVSASGGSGASYSTNSESSDSEQKTNNWNGWSLTAAGTTLNGIGAGASSSWGSGTGNASSGSNGGISVVFVG